MTTIIQMNYDDLMAAIKNSQKEVINEILELPVQPELPDKIGFHEALEHCAKRGRKISESKGRKDCADGKMPIIGKFGRRIIFSRKELDEWLEAMTVKLPNPNDVMTEQLAKVAGKKR